MNATQWWQTVADEVRGRRVTSNHPNRNALAAVAGVHYATLARLEKGQPVSMDTLAKIGAKLGCRPGYLQALSRGATPDQAAEPEDELQELRAKTKHLAAQLAEAQETLGRLMARLDEREACSRDAG